MPRTAEPATAVGHGTPVMTVAEAHTAMQEHLRCRSDHCPQRRTALAVLVHTGRYVLPHAPATCGHRRAPAPSACPIRSGGPAPVSATHEASYSTVVRLVRAHCHPDVPATAYPVLVLRACTRDPQMARLQTELRHLLGGGLADLPRGVLYAAAGYPEDDDESFLRRLWDDLYGNQPV